MKKYSKCIPIGDKLYIEKMNFDIQIQSEGIILPMSYSKNCALGVAKIIETTKTVNEKWNLYNGDYIVYDFHSVYDKDTITQDQVAIIDGENVILKLTEQEAHEFQNKYLR